MIRCDMIYLLTSIRVTPGGSSTVHIYTQTIHRTTQLTTRTTQTTTNWEECGPCPVYASYTLAFALQLRKRHGKTSVRVAEECHQLARLMKYEINYVRKIRLVWVDVQCNNMILTEY